ncbi:hypothetical protein ACFWPU_01130 [Streptomyces sp. NPDC058471]|uniref:hypothetical protein n=1 Tax=Streptomyces sp. NPDC058471 TaxID=3346516 RepID=UPI003659B3F7
MTAREYREWEAYERATGPLDSGYEREMLAQLHELAQLGNLLAGRPQKRGGKNAAGKFKKAPRPEYLTNPYLYLDEEEPEDGDDVDEIDDVDYADDEIEDSTYESDPNAYDPSKDPFAGPEYNNN